MPQRRWNNPSNGLPPSLRPVPLAQRFDHFRAHVVRHPEHPNGSQPAPGAPAHHQRGRFAKAPPPRPIQQDFPIPQAHQPGYAGDAQRMVPASKQPRPETALPGSVQHANGIPHGGHVRRLHVHNEPTAKATRAKARQPEAIRQSKGVLSPFSRGIRNCLDPTTPILQPERTQ